MKNAHVGYAGFSNKQITQLQEVNLLLCIMDTAIISYNGFIDMEKNNLSIFKLYFPNCSRNRKRKQMKIKF